VQAEAAAQQKQQQTQELVRNYAEYVAEGCISPASVTSLKIVDNGTGAVQLTETANLGPNSTFGTALYVYNIRMFPTVEGLRYNHLLLATRRNLEPVIWDTLN
jgi:hypothetical protein